MTDAFIYDAVRTPRGKGRKDGSLHEVTPVRLAVAALQVDQPVAAADEGSQHEVERDAGVDHHKSSLNS